MAETVATSMSNLCRSHIQNYCSMCSKYRTPNECPEFVVRNHRHGVLLSNEKNDTQNIDAVLN